MTLSAHRDLTNSHMASAPVLPLFHPVSQILDSKNHYHSKSQDLFHEQEKHIRITDLIKVLVHNCKIGPEGAVFRTSGKVPPHQGPEQRPWTLPHAVQHQMHKTAPCQHEHLRIGSFTEEIVANNAQYYNKEQCMRKDPSTGKYILKQKSSYRLINNIRQHGAYQHIPVIDMRPDLRESPGYDVEQCKGYSDVCKGEHGEVNTDSFFKYVR